MIVCVCHRVSEAQIAGYAQAGGASFEDLQDDLRVGTGCGTCLDCARETFEAARQPAGACCAGSGERRPAALAAA